MTPADATPHGTEMVVRRGKLFEVGHYADKQFSMSPDELRAAVEQFSDPLPIDLEHVPTILDGKLGRVDRVWLSDDGRELHGEVSLPSWLDRLMEDGGRKVSATWNRATKSLEKLALVRSPRLKDAALFAEFAAANPEEAEALFSTPRKHHPHLTMIWQGVHDQCAMTPGICPANPVTPTTPATMGDMTLQQKHLKTAHDHSVMHGAACSGRAMMSDDSTLPGETPVPTADNATAEFDDFDNDLDLDDTDAADVTDAEIDAFVDEHPAVVALKAKLAAAEAKAAAITAKFAEQAEDARRKAVAAQAVAFADAEIKAGRTLTANRDDEIAAFADAAELDHQLGQVVTFSDAAGAAAKGSRVEALKARSARRPAHSLFSPALGDGELLHDGEKVLFNTGKGARDDGPMNEAQRREYLSKSQAGIAILAQEDLEKKGK